MQASKNERLSIRIPSPVKSLLLTAATARHKTLSDFVLDIAMREAETVLSEQRVFALSDKAWEEFQTALDQPPQTHPRMQKLLQEPSVFDEQP